MKAFIAPTTIKQANIFIPASKSLLHRSLICAALCTEETIIENVYLNNDVIATIECLKSLGADISVNNTNNNIIIRVKGITKPLKKVTLNAYESGSTLRFMIPICYMLVDEAIIYGTKKLISRPLDVYKKIYGSNLIIKEDHIIIKKGPEINEYVIEDCVSSQFVSGILFSLPLHKNNPKIKILKKLESFPYVLLTISVLEKFNIHIKYKKNIFNKQEFYTADRVYNGCKYFVESDYSQAAFFIVLGLINNDLQLHLLEDSLQGDKKIIAIMKKMHGLISFEKNNLNIKKSQLKGTKIDISDCPDLGPILFVAALFANSKTIITGFERLVYKESNRLKAIMDCLKHYNSNIIQKKKKIIIIPQKISYDNQLLNSYNDHRICMACAILGTVYGANIDGIECINKSYPTFFDDLKQLGVEVKIDE